MEILNFESINKGHLLAKFTIRIKDWGNLTINEVLLFEKEGNRWINLPSRSYDKGGKKKNFPLVFFPKEVLDRLQLAIIAKIASKNYEEKAKNNGPTPF